MNEEWRSVVGYEGLYSVSIEGVVRSESRRVAHPMGGDVLLPTRVLKQSRQGSGYWKVSLCRDGKQRTRSVHQLVAEAFIGPRPAGMEVAHDDGVKTNNSAHNLRYDTRAGNNRDKRRHGTWAGGEKIANAKLTPESVAAIRKSAGIQRDIAATWGVSQGTVSRIRTGKRWAHLENAHE